MPEFRTLRGVSDAQRETRRALREIRRALAITDLHSDDIKIRDWAAWYLALADHAEALQIDLNTVTAERDGGRARLATIAVLHHNEQGYCHEDTEPWPCDTYKATAVGVLPDGVQA